MKYQEAVWAVAHFLCELVWGLVSVDCALGRHQDPSLTLAFAASNQWIGHGLNHWTCSIIPRYICQCGVGSHRNLEMHFP